MWKKGRCTSPCSGLFGCVGRFRMPSAERTPSVLPLRVKPPSPRGRLNSLSQNLTVWPAPSGREPLAWRESLRFCQGPHLRGGCRRRRLGEFYPRRAALSQKAARQLPFSSTPPPVKMQCRSVRRRSGIALLKIIFPLFMRRAKRSALKSFVPRQAHCQESTAHFSTLSSTARCKAFSMLRCAP